MFSVDWKGKCVTLWMNQTITRSEYALIFDDTVKQGYKGQRGYEGQISGFFLDGSRWYSELKGSNSNIWYETLACGLETAIPGSWTRDPGGISIQIPIPKSRRSRNPENAAFDSNSKYGLAHAGQVMFKQCVVPGKSWVALNSEYLFDTPSSRPCFSICS